MRIQDNEIVTATCVNTMDRKDVNGGTPPVTDIKYSPSRSDAVNANGILSPPTTPSTTTPSESEYASSASGSGRFKFFKDGKFILELWHHKNHWIPVSKNSSTFWLPTGHCTPRQESSTSLSVSDDNSSIQSSPWQRDHCWKQTVPRKNINRELEFMMRHPRSRKKRFSSTAIRRRRRRPYETIKLEVCVKLESTFKLEPQVKVEPSDEVDGSEHDIHVNKKPTTTNSSLHTRKLCDIVQKLLERRTFEHAANSCRTDPGIVSPRKRILKEMERVSLEEMSNTNKKHRARTATSNASGSVVTVATGTICGPATTTSTYTASTAITASAKSTSSHSISSILSRYEEPSFLRNLLKSPSEESKITPPCAGVDTLVSGGEVRIPLPSHCSTPVKSSLSPPHSSSKNLHCPQPIPPYISSSYLYPPVQGFLASPPISNHPPYYSTAFPPPHAYRDSAVWSMPSVSSPYRQSVLASSNVSSYPPLNPPAWIPIAHSPFPNYSVNENGTDVPLNLSKH